MKVATAGIFRPRPPVGHALKSERRDGFTLPEGLFGMAIVAIMFVSLYTGMAAGFRSIHSSRENLRATQLLLEKFETIRLYHWGQVTTPGFIPTNFTAYFNPDVPHANTYAVVHPPGCGTVYRGTVTISPAPVSEPYSEDLRVITVELAWESGGRPCTRSLSSYVARYGLQNYVY